MLYATCFSYIVGCTSFFSFPSSFHEVFKVIYVNNWYKIAQNFDQTAVLIPKPPPKTYDGNVFLRIFSLYNSRWKKGNEKKTLQQEPTVVVQLWGFVSALQPGHRHGGWVGRSVGR